MGEDEQRAPKRSGVVVPVSSADEFGDESIGLLDDDLIAAAEVVEAVQRASRAEAISQRAADFSAFMSSRLKIGPLYGHFKVVPIASEGNFSSLMLEADGVVQGGCTLGWDDGHAGHIVSSLSILIEFILFN